MAAVDADRVYCFFGKSGVVAFDHNGKQVWTADVGNKIHEWGSASSPVLYGDLVFINASVESATLYAFDKKTGAEIWSQVRAGSARDISRETTEFDGTAAVRVHHPGLFVLG